mgnify:CR=1|jgi:hypothetical protein|tara:strand:+ start:159 stop:740 length:582 start_codon:yes stop_codon:yes gene_type:complete
MTKAMMQKWQRDWFVKELDRDYNPLIQAAELKIKSLEAEAIEIAEKNLADDIGATPIIEELQQAIETVKSKMSKAARFFRTSKVAKKKDINYKFQEKEFNLDGYGSNRITPEDCWEQIRDWAGDFARKQIEKTPEGKALKILEDNKRVSLKDIMEAGSPADLKEKLQSNLKKDGLTWTKDQKALPPATDQTIN